MCIFTLQTGVVPAKIGALRMRLSTKIGIVAHIAEQQDEPFEWFCENFEALVADIDAAPVVLEDGTPVIKLNLNAGAHSVPVSISQVHDETRVEFENIADITQEDLEKSRVFVRSGDLDVAPAVPAPWPPEPHSAPDAGVTRSMMGHLSDRKWCGECGTWSVKAFAETSGKLTQHAYVCTDCYDNLESDD